MSQGSKILANVLDGDIATENLRLHEAIAFKTRDGQRKADGKRAAEQKLPHFLGIFMGKPGKRERFAALPLQLIDLGERIVAEIPDPARTQIDVLFEPGMGHRLEDPEGVGIASVENEYADPFFFRARGVAVAIMPRNESAAPDPPHDCSVIHHFLQRFSDREEIALERHRQVPFRGQFGPDRQRFRQLAEFGFDSLVFQLDVHRV